MGSGKEERGGDEEEGRGYLCPEDSEPGPGGDLRWQVDGPHRSYEEDLGVHQEGRVEQRAGDQAGRQAEGYLPGCEPRHVEDGRLREQALRETLGEPWPFRPAAVAPGLCTLTRATDTAASSWAREPGIAH